MTSPAVQEGAASSPKLRRALWLWPAASAALAAWPVWRSLFSEVPDVGEGWHRLQILAGLGNALLYVAWELTQRRRIRGSLFPRLAIALATGGLAVAIWRDEPGQADLNALMLCWIAVTTIFAALVLRHVAQAGIAARCAPLRHVTLFPPIPGLTVGLGVLFAVAVLLGLMSPRNNLAIVGVVSPGLILAWASLSDTARSVLSKRQTYFADAGALLALARRRRWLLRAPTILLSDRVKLVNLYAAAGIKPGELVGLAAAATMNEAGDIDRAIQEFGVSHRIRLPELRARAELAPSPARQASLANGAVVELCAIGEDLDLAPYAEAIELARSQHRIVMAVRERAPGQRVLGVIVFAIAARPGAAEALRVLRDRDIDVALSAPPRNAADEAALKSLSVARAAATSRGGASAGEQVTSVLRTTQSVADLGGGPVVAFGAHARHASPRPDIVVARENARALVDLARFADDFRTRAKVVTLLASIPGWMLIGSALGYLPASPFLVTGVALIGIVLATATPQVLRLSPTLDKEGTEE